MDHWEGAPQVKLPKTAGFSPLKKFEHVGIDVDRELGEDLLSRGKVGCLILAAGLGSRLGFEGPKGCFPVSVIEKKSLFQLLFERVAAIQKKWNCQLPLIILLSSNNRDQTIRFLRSHHFFGLLESQVTCVEQHNYPYFDCSGRVLVDKLHIMAAPNGNGGALDVLHPVMSAWAKQGIEYMHIIPVDNPLLDPFDPYMTGVLERKQADIVVKAIERTDAHENVGLLVEGQQKIHVVDYMEIEADVFTAQDGQGKLTYALGNCGHYCARLSFLLSLEHTLPLHWIEKKVKVGRFKVAAWKGEKFIFDLLPMATRAVVICYPRQLCFAPLKSLRGVNGVAALQKALLHRDRITFKQISGQQLPQRRFELAAEFLHPTDAILSEWKGKTLPPHSYIKP